MDETHPVAVVMHTAAVTVGVYAAILLAAVMIGGALIGLWALVTWLI